MFQSIKSLFSSGLFQTVGLSFIGTGSYVLYQDYARTERMTDAYCHGKIMRPLAWNEHETPYFKRPDLEERLTYILSPTFSNEYYLVTGEVGTGKTRVITNMVREMIRENGTQGKGAPIYVSVEQGKTFPDTLAEAVNFRFDEHLTFKFFVEVLFQVSSFPQRDDHNKIRRVLAAVEESAYQYTHEYQRPVVLVIDGVHNLNKHMPGTLEKLQEKAKLWADSNIAKVVFVSNDEEAEEILQSNVSNWSRAGEPVKVGDLSHSEAINLLHDHHAECCKEETADHTRAHHKAEAIYNAVGGRFNHLITFRNDYRKSIQFEKTLERLKGKEREKFLAVSKKPKCLSLLQKLMAAPNKCLPLVKMAEDGLMDIVAPLAKANIVAYDRTREGAIVKFESKLTETVVQEMTRK